MRETSKHYVFNISVQWCLLLTFFSGPSPFTDSPTSFPLIIKSAGASEVGVVEDTDQSCINKMLPSVADGGITSGGSLPFAVTGVSFKEFVFCWTWRWLFLMCLDSDVILFWFVQIALSSSSSLNVVSELLSHELVSLGLGPRSSCRIRLLLEEPCESESDQLNLRFWKEKGFDEELNHSRLL